jgi:hypothetical protein
MEVNMKSLFILVMVMNPSWLSIPEVRLLVGDSINETAIYSSKSDCEKQLLKIVSNTKQDNFTSIERNDDGGIFITNKKQDSFVFCREVKGV